MKIAGVSAVQRTIIKQIPNTDTIRLLLNLRKKKEFFPATVFACENAAWESVENVRIAIQVAGKFFAVHGNGK